MCRQSCDQGCVDADSAHRRGPGRRTGTVPADLPADLPADHPGHNAKLQNTYCCGVFRTA
ncbi:hypothetical protein I545_6055 [Mycobacterium kansasii 662]|uniref:Uncharacterized protein n=1 Tax=Mycobacterium kansasii 662 TaxID=1299326 RepID=X7YS07_MYCKA|nr:hypothetical protein I545_6055 [Mycobacterium kansasii 662]